MLATIAIAALLAAAPAQEIFEEEQDGVVFYEDESEEIALNEESEYQDLVFFEDESEFAEELLDEDDE